MRRGGDGTGGTGGVTTSSNSSFISFYGVDVPLELLFKVTGESRDYVYLSREVCRR